MREFPIIDKLGGREATFRRLNGRGADIKTTSALRMWTKREQIPGDAQVLLMQIADDLGIAYSASDFSLIETVATAPQAAE